MIFGAIVTFIYFVRSHCENDPGRFVTKKYLKLFISFIIVYLEESEFKNIYIYRLIKTDLGR